MILSANPNFNEIDNKDKNPNASVISEIMKERLQHFLEAHNLRSSL